MSGIEPPYPPWQGGVLPLNYTRKMAVPTRIELAISSVTGRHVSHYTTEPYSSKNEEFKSFAIKKLYSLQPNLFDGASERNRTAVSTLARWCSTVELHSQNGGSDEDRTRDLLRDREAC